MRIIRLDHLVLTVKDIEASITFYSNLGFFHEVFANNRHALKFGGQKINLHQYGAEFEPKAANVMPGSADLCFIINQNDFEGLPDLLANLGIPIEDGPVKRTGASGKPINSIYIRDPDRNLLEFSYYI